MLYEPVMLDTAPVYLGFLYVCDGVPTVSEIGTTQVPATVADLKTALTVAEVRQIDVPTRRTGYLLPYPLWGGIRESGLDIFET